MNYLRQSTAIDIAIGPFIDDDGITPATGLSITQAETRLKKNNGAWAQANDNTTATHEEEGWYEKELDATDTNTVGILIVAVYIAGSLAYWKEFQVVEEAVYDALFAASATGALPVSAGGIVAASFGVGAIDAASLAADAGAELGTAVWATATRALTVLDEDSTTLDLDTTIRAAVGMAAANFDTQIGDLPTNAELATSQGTADDAILAAIAALNNISVANILGATVEGSTTLVQSLRLLNAALGGKASGLATTTATYRNLADDADRIVATVDADGNRSAVTLTLT